jgi:membrane fusion protein (multidrug efflux system)
MNRYQPQVRLARSLVLCFAAISIIACSKTSDKPEAKAAPEVGVVIVQQQAQPILVELPGRTTARMIAEIRPQVGGIIQQRTFTEGSHVKAGDLLYQIEPAIYQAALASADASVQKANASLAATTSRAVRYAELVKLNAVSRQENDDILASVKQAEADLALAKAALITARINLDFTRIVAPISGRVEVSSVTPGALVTANQVAALTMVQQLDPIYVDVTQSSSELLRLKRDLASGSLKKSGNNETQIKVVLEDGSIYPHAGILKVSGITVNPTSGAVTLRAVVPNKEGLLLPGMYVHARLQEAVNENAILVPQQGVSRNSRGEPTVLLVNAENKVELRVLSADNTIGNQWLVNSGLTTGDQVILEGMDRIKVGDTVRPVVVKLGVDNAGAKTPMKQ